MFSSADNTREQDQSGPCLVGTSEMASFIRDFAWERISLGPLTSWPDSLLGLLNVILFLKFPAAIFWGDQMTQLYNDAFCSLLGLKHPEALGKPAREVWSEAWALIGGQLEKALVGESIKIRIRPVTDWRTGKPGVRVTIADNGHGISAKTRGDLYKPFFTTKESTGTGLGLWISAEVIQRHHGTITVRSSDKAGSSGTTFSLLFPADGLGTFEQSLSAS